MSSKFLTAKNLRGLYLMSPLLLVLPGCATRSWVSEQLNPVGTRMTKIEQRMSETDSRLSGTDARLASLVSVQLKPLGTRVAGIEQRMSGAENRLTSAERDISQVGAKTDETLRELKNLRLERRLVLNLKQGAYFKPNSATLLEPAKKNIDKFLSSLERQPADNHLFFVAGYTDSTGSSGYNYELGRKRADSVGRYLIIKKAPCLRLKNLRLERRLVLNLKQGAYFKPNSATLLEPAKKNIDKFLSSLERQPADNHLFFVAGYTDSTGSSGYNYELGRKRADSVGRYLIIKKAIHPTRVITTGPGLHDCDLLRT